MNRARAGVGAAAIGICLAGGWIAWSARRPDQTSSPPRPATVTATSAERIRVEVMNATRARGLARQATSILRNAGLDVVLVATSTAQRDSTLVLDRSNHPEWARRVALALGGARVESRPDSTRYVDVSVLLGGTWRPPAQPLHP